MRRTVKLLPPAKTGIGAVLLLTSRYVHDDGGFPGVIQPHDEEGHISGERQQRVSVPETGCAPWGAVTAAGPGAPSRGTLRGAAVLWLGEEQDGDAGAG